MEAEHSALALQLWHSYQQHTENARSAMETEHKISESWRSLCSSVLSSMEQSNFLTWVLVVEGAPVHLVLKAGLGCDGRRPPIGQRAPDGRGRVPSCRPVHAVELNWVTWGMSKCMSKQRDGACLLSTCIQINRFGKVSGSLFQDRLHPRRRQPLELPHWQDTECLKSNVKHNSPNYLHSALPTKATRKIQTCFSYKTAKWKKIIPGCLF